MVGCVGCGGWVGLGVGEREVVGLVIGEVGVGIVGLVIGVGVVSGDLLVVDFLVVGCVGIVGWVGIVGVVDFVFGGSVVVVLLGMVGWVGIVGVVWLRCVMLFV